MKSSFLPSLEAAQDHAAFTALARYLRKRELRIARSSGSHGPYYDKKVFIQLQEITRARARVRKEQRHAAIARGLAKGVTYYEIERLATTHQQPDWERVKTYLKKYIGRDYFVHALTRDQLEGTVPLREIFDDLSARGQLGHLMSDWRQTRRRKRPTSAQVDTLHEVYKRTSFALGVANKLYTQFALQAPVPSHPELRADGLYSTHTAYLNEHFEKSVAFSKAFFPQFD